MSVDASADARVVGISTEFRDLRAGGVQYCPQRIAVFGMGRNDVTYSSTKRQVTSAKEVGDRYGYGSPLHLAVRELFPKNGDGVGTIPVTVYPLQQGYEASTATATITPGGTQTKQASYRVRCGGVQTAAFVIDVSESVASRCDKIVAAINAVLEMPVEAADGTTVVNLTAKWDGPTGNDIVVEVLGDLYGGTFTIVQPSGGLVNPTVDDALDQVGSTWETMALNTLGIDDDTALDTFQEFGEGRWGELVRKPLVVFTGYADDELGDATGVTDARSDDRVNSLLVAPGSPNLPFVIAARQLARIAKVANNNPPKDYGAQKATGLIPGTDAQQWDYSDRDTAVKAGTSTIEVRDGVVTIADVVTMHHPDGEDPPAYRYVCDIVKLQNIIYNLDLIFSAEEWASAPLIPDDQPTVNPDARKPKSAKAAVCALLDNLGLQAIISDPKTAKENTSASINSQNPKRLDVSTTVQLSGNTNVKSIDLFFGFFFGSSGAVS